MSRYSPAGGSGTSFANASTLGKFGESNGVPTFNGSPIASGTNPTAIDQPTWNLFDKTRLVVGSYHDATTGNIITGGYETHAITVKPNYHYTFNRGDGINMQYSFYASDGTYITGGTAKMVRAPVNAVTLYVHVLSTAQADVLVILESSYYFADYLPYTQKYISLQPVQGLFTSKWYGKTWWVHGDSISTGVGDGVSAGNAYASKPYHYVLARQRGIHVQSDASSGYTIGNIYDNDVVNMPPSANAPDLITIMAGTNDHGYNITLGAITDDPATGTTFYSRYRKTVEYLMTNFPNASIGLITPIQRGGSTKDGNVANAVGKTLRDYCDAVVAIAKYYSLPVLDWYYSLGFSPYNSQQNQLYYCSTTDFTHPNDLGHSKMASAVGKFIESI